MAGYWPTEASLLENLSAFALGAHLGNRVLPEARSVGMPTQPGTPRAGGEGGGVNARLPHLPAGGGVSGCTGLPLSLYLEGKVGFYRLPLQPFPWAFSARLTGQKGQN